MELETYYFVIYGWVEPCELYAYIQHYWCPATKVGVMLGASIHDPFVTKKKCQSKRKEGDDPEILFRCHPICCPLLNWTHCRPT